MLERAIGGYFELETPSLGKELYPNSLKFQSARAGFYALIMALQPKRLWMPYYICQSMLDPLKAADFDVSFYSIFPDLSIRDRIDLGEGEYIFYVNYFGVCSQNQVDILEIYGPEKIIFDHSQALFQKPFDCLATIYSPRKFVGVPDGGLLISNVAVSEPVEFDPFSASRATHLLARLDDQVEQGYAAFLSAEATLNDFTPKRMSHLTNRILGGIDFESIRLKRNSNFSFLHAHLKEYNELRIEIESVDGPLCYPFLSKNSALREYLISHKIYVPKYWAGCGGNGRGSSEEYLSRHILPIPCDQRYGLSEMRFISSLINAGLG